MIRFAPGLFAVLACWLPQTAGAQPPVQDGKIRVFIDRPEPFSPVFGEVEMVVTVAADEPVERVVLYVDGMVVAELTRPPYRSTVDAGADNREHRFEAIAYGASGKTGSAAVETPQIQVDEEVTISLQQLYVTVTRDGQRVLDLGLEDFTAYDEGRPQRLVTFARGDIPFTAVVLVDASVSMQGEKLRSALAGARAFFGGMDPLDEGRLFVFSDRILHRTPFTTFPEILAAGLGRIRARGGTALADHLYLALKQLEDRQGRRVVVLLSDGFDWHSVLSMDDVLRQARRSQALIYWLRLPYQGEFPTGEALPGLASPWRDSASYRREFTLLSATVEESGGRIRLLRSVDDINPAFEGIRQELREQYALGYYPDGLLHDGSWRRVRVEIRRPGMEARARDGYIDF